MSSLKSNILLNYINTITGLIFPLITFPYAARVLGPECMGVIDFQNSFINYIVLFSSLGIPFYGIREIAKFRDNDILRNQKLIEIFLLNLFLCFIGYIVVFIISITISQIQENVDIFYILSSAILFTAIGVQWFYQGIEDFRFITIRGIIVRIICAVSLFIFVKSKEDLFIYAIVLTGTTVGNNFINFIHLRKYISKKTTAIKTINIRQHIRPTLKIFLMFACVSIYIYLNIIILGFMQGDKAVGLYSYSVKIPTIINTVITSLGAVMLPRCSNLIENGNTTEFSRIITKSFHFISAMAFPCSCAIIVLAEPLTMVFCGEKYLEATTSLRIVASTIIFVSYSNIFGMQILFPKNKESIVIKSIFISSVISIILNLALIPLLAQNGAAIATLVTEAFIMLLEIVYGYKYIKESILNIRINNYIIGTILMSLAIGFCCIFISNHLFRLLIASFAGIVTYIIYLIYKKDEIALVFINSLKNTL